MFIFVQKYETVYLNDNEEMMRIAEIQIKSYFEHNIDEVFQVKEVLASLNDNAEQENDIHRIIEHSEDLYRIEILDENGTINRIFPHSEARQNLDMSKNKIYSEIKNLEKDYLIGEPFIDTESGGITLPISIKTDDEKYIVGYLGINTLQVLIDEISSDRGNLSIVDDNGNYIAHIDEDYVLQRKVDPFFNKMQAGKLNGKIISELGSSKFYLRSSNIDETNLNILVYIDASFITNLRRNIILVGFISLLILIPLGIMSISKALGKVDKTVNNIVDLTDNISQGVYDFHEEDNIFQEFDQIFINFKKMINEVETREEKINNLNSELENNYISTLIMMAKVIEAKDKYTGNHSERVRQYALMLGEELNFDEEDIKELRYGSTLHDIGKIAISENIINKRDKYTDEEFDIMKMHSNLGHDIIENMDFIPRAKEIVLYHHERIDGRGYPLGLENEEIPILARIVSIADAFDAMTTNRVYKNKMSFEEAKNELIENAGTQFDSNLVDIFIKVFDEDLLSFSSNEDEM